MKLRIGVLCPSEIAFRRFAPAIKELEDSFEFVGVAHANEVEWFGKVSSDNNLSVLESDFIKAKKFVETYGGKVFNSFMELISCDDVDAIYIPLPPALHYKWAKICLENKKHVLLEKPSTTKYEDTKELIDIAIKNNLALHENYMFRFHNQISEVINFVNEKNIGIPYLYRLNFGFPFRGKNDFRYNQKLGGGALLDCGGYTIKLANIILGEDCKLNYHFLNYDKELGVDIFGYGVLTNNNGTICEVAFGMNNEYKCELEVWGSKGYFSTNRIFTAPAGFIPEGKLISGGKEYKMDLPMDDTFKKSIVYFSNCILNSDIRNESYKEILKQADFIEQFRR